MNDDELLARAMRGDRDAFARLVKTHEARMLRFASGLVGDRQSACDIVQDALVRLWRSRERYRPQGAATAYLLRVVRSACLDHLRASRRWDHVRIDEDEASDSSCEAVVLAGALQEALRQALLRLPEAQRAVYVLSEYEGATYQEIASILGCAPGTVASRKHAATEALRAALRPWLEGESDDRA